MNLETLLQDKIVIAGTGSRQLRVELDNESHHRHALAERVLHQLRDELAQLKSRYGDALVVLSGGSEGFDEELAYAAFELGIPYALAIPSPGYGDFYWGRTSLTTRDRASCAPVEASALPSGAASGDELRLSEWDELLGHALAIEITSTELLGLDPGALTLGGQHVNLHRNRRMIELASGVIIYDAGSPGTRHAVGLIERLGVPQLTLGEPGAHFDLPACRECGRPSFVDWACRCPACASASA